MKHNGTSTFIVTYEGRGRGRKGGRNEGRKGGRGRGEGGA